jgi:hypothetical protein
MHSIRVKEMTGKDGVLHLHVPVGRPNTECEVIVVVQPKEPSTQPKTPEELGWPPGFFDKVAGSITDETFIRHPQGELPPRVEFD